ncbi:MAG TPA: penicillin-binding protein 2, partial [Thermoleophilaceae bacterium]|nr:penicillin-binding protein 2 [Thermoleophilaceae bacterium]
VPATQRRPPTRRARRGTGRPPIRLVERRIGLLFALFLMALTIAALRATWLGTVKSGSLSERAVSQQIEDIADPARRGTIVDRNGVELAVSEDSMTVFAHPFLIKDPVKTAARLAPLVGRKEDDLLRELSGEKTFVYLRRKMDASLGERIEKLEIEGIGTVTEPKRVYPQGYMASQVLGIVGVDNVGLAGLEYSRDKALRGEDGERRLVKDALGEPVSLIETKRSEPGEDLALTLDARIQERTEAVLSEVGETYTPQGATAVVMDPRTGEILALANWPRVDANNLDGAPDFAKQNRAVQANYEPGSTFKAFTVAGALSERLVEPSTTLAVPPEITVADRTVGEAHDAGGGTKTVSQVLAESSNVGSVMIGLKLGAERFDKWVRRFGFGQPTGVDLPGEQMGIVLRPENYSGSSMGNMPIGQGIAVTPMQMASAYTAIANHGVMRRPYIVQGNAPPPKRVLSRRVADQVSHMLEGVLAAGGTAEEASVEGYTLAGKTGTAEKAIEGGYSETDFVASFIGYAPAKDPRLLVAVMVDTPRGDIYGGTVAAPAFERIVEFALPYLKIPPG